MEDLKTLKVGDKVWVIGYPAHTRKPSIEFHRGTVTKRGRKYITVKRDDDTWPKEAEYSLEDGRNKSLTYSQNRTWKLYIDLDAYKRAAEREKLERLFLNAFTGYSTCFSKEVTTDDIRAAAKLLRIHIGEGNKE